jgi:putative glutathione S-transferase
MIQLFSNRYHLYISHACPWAHRTLMVRALKGLNHVIGVSVVDYLMESNGWKFSTPEETPGENKILLSLSNWQN